MSLQGTLALVTGAAGDTGTATCQALAQAGATVIAAGRRHSASVPGASEWVELDVTSEDNWDRVIDLIQKRYGRLDILVNNAGINRIEKFEDVSLESWRATQAVNVEGVFLGIQRALPLLKQSGPNRRGGASVINISSIAGLVGAELNSAYCASKGAVRLLTKALALEFSALGYRIRVNSIHPGGINTGMVESIFQASVDLGLLDSRETARQLATAAHPLGRLAEPTEIAAGIRFLASCESSYMQGSELTIDGGYTAR
ncbi:MAG: SDR family oxidoreductase [Porticoccaceae bacterium]|nr:SDR family oxidoreductase [Porticoccaceae bacterium]